MQDVKEELSHIKNEMSYGVQVPYYVYDCIAEKEKEIIDFFQSIKYLHEKDAKSDRDRKLINIAGIELNHLMKSE